MFSDFFFAIDCKKTKSKNKQGKILLLFVKKGPVKDFSSVNYIEFDIHFS